MSNPNMVERVHSIRDHEGNTLRIHLEYDRSVYEDGIAQATVTDIEIVPAEKPDKTKHIPDVEGYMNQHGHLVISRRVEAQDW